MTLIDQPKKCEKIRASRGSKDELKYWKRCLRPVPGSPYLYIELQRKGVRKKISLETSNRTAAAYRAREIWQFVRLHGWEGYMAKYRPERIAPIDVSVGDYLEAVKKCADLSPRTAASYIGALHKITSDICGYSADSTRFGHGKGKRAWLGRVHAVKLSALSPKAIQQWKIAFIARAENDPLAQRSARVSANSFLRCARSLFSKRILAHLDLELPTPLPFAGVQFEPRQSCKYRSSVDITKLIECARTELATQDPESFKVFLLATFAGLRRKEIDLLPWSAFRWDAGCLRIETTAHFAAKSEDSLGDVSLENEVLAFFRNAPKSGEFVIESEGLPRTAGYNTYRCLPVFERLITWLRNNGVNGPKPLHTLRKEFGSEVAKHFGIYAASRALRHSDISVTTQFYTEDRTRSVMGLGHLLSDKVVEFKREGVA